MMSVLDNAYKNLSGFGATDATNFSKPSSKHVVLTYGELTLEGYKKMMTNIKTNGRNFYDLGSGIGKVIMYSYLYSNFDKCIGVEYHKGRVSQARTARKRILRSLSKNKTRNRTSKKTSKSSPVLLKGSFLNKKYFANNKDSVYFISNLCFSDHTNRRLAYYFDKYRGNSKYKTIIFSGRELPITTCNKSPKILNVKMSWSDSSTIYKYIL
jgi:hypothetical protein